MSYISISVYQKSASPRNFETTTCSECTLQLCLHNWTSIAKAKLFESAIVTISMEDLAKVKHLLKESVTCNVCQEVHSKVLQCTNAHTTCSDCFPQLDGGTCPECRASSGWVKGRLIEEMCNLVQLEFSCTHKGCAMKHKLDSVDDHRKICEHRMFACPLFPYGCAAVARTQLVDHLRLHSSVRVMQEGDTLNCTVKYFDLWKLVVIWDDIPIVLQLQSPWAVGPTKAMFCSMQANTIGNIGSVVKANVTNISACRRRTVMHTFDIEELSDTGTPKHTGYFETFRNTLCDNAVYVNGPLRGVREVEVVEDSIRYPCLALSIQFSKTDRTV